MKKTNLVWLIIKNWFKLQYKFLSSKSVHLFVFIVVNVVIGSLGVWMTILMTRIVNIQSFDIELSKVLEASGPYTFAVAYLAASTSYVAYEYLEDRRTCKRKTNTTLTTAAFVLIILCTLLSAFQTKLFDTPSALTNKNTAIPSQLIEPLQANINSEKVLTVQEKLQLWLVLISIFIGLALYLISRWDDEDAILMLQEYNSKIREESLALENKMSNDNQASHKLSL